jgi:hypothetical protein
MDADQCQIRAAACAANALVAVDNEVSLEFLKLAAQWRAMAVRTIVLGSADPLGGGSAPPGLGAPTGGLIAPIAPPSE